jgi:hypothetical protein
MSKGVRAVLLGGFVVGTLDALDAIVFFGVRAGATPDRIFKGIAAGLFGPGARSGGWPMVIAGVLCHYVIATLIVLTAVAIGRLFPVLVRRPLISGPVFGVAAFLVMNLVVIPNSAIGAGGLPTGAGLANGLLIHVFGVGIPAVFAARSALASSRSR